jgi:hypothetical protein
MAEELKIPEVKLPKPPKIELVRELSTDIPETIKRVVDAVFEPIDEAIDEAERNLERIGVPTLRPVRLKLKELRKDIQRRF